MNENILKLGGFVCYEFRQNGVEIMMRVGGGEEGVLFTSKKLLVTSIMSCKYMSIHLPLVSKVQRDFQYQNI